MKSKAEELAILQTAITQLGSDSYLGPWLASVSDEVARDVRCDILPDYSLEQARKDCQALRDHTAQMITEWKETARQENERRTNETTQKIASALDNAAGSLRVALRAIEY